jgi:hypothetical protein
VQPIEIQTMAFLQNHLGLPGKSTIRTILTFERSPFTKMSWNSAVNCLKGREECETRGGAMITIERQFLHLKNLPRLNIITSNSGRFDVNQESLRQLHRAFLQFVRTVRVHCFAERVRPLQSSGPSPLLALSRRLVTRHSPPTPVSAFTVRLLLDQNHRELMHRHLNAQSTSKHLFSLCRISFGCSLCFC